MAEPKKETKATKPKEEAKPAEMAVAAPKPKATMMIGMIGGIVALQVVLTIVAIKFLKPSDPQMIAENVKKQMEEHERAKQTSVGKTSEPMSLIVNLSGKDSERFLKTEIVLEYEGAEEGGGPGEGGGEMEHMIEVRKPKLKDIAIGVLTSCTYDDVKDREGKKKVLERLKAEMNKIFPKPDAVTNVYFDGFIIQ